MGVLVFFINETAKPISAIPTSAILVADSQSVRSLNML
jgi:hypothetical protein